MLESSIKFTIPEKKYLPLKEINDQITYFTRILEFKTINDVHLNDRDLTSIVDLLYTRSEDNQPIDFNNLFEKFGDFIYTSTFHDVIKWKTHRKAEYVKLPFFKKLSFFNIKRNFYNFSFRILNKNKIPTPLYFHFLADKFERQYSKKQFFLYYNDSEKDINYIFPFSLSYIRSIYHHIDIANQLLCL